MKPSLQDSRAIRVARCVFSTSGVIAFQPQLPSIIREIGYLGRTAILRRYNEVERETIEMGQVVGPAVDFYESRHTADFFHRISGVEATAMKWRAKNTTQKQGDSDRYIRPTTHSFRACQNPSPNRYYVHIQ